jgi:hypothetical protein
MKNNQFTIIFDFHFYHHTLSSIISSKSSNLSNQFIKLLLRCQIHQKLHLFPEHSNSNILNLVFLKIVTNKV